jgi:hypothetical protein
MSNRSPNLSIDMTKNSIGPYLLILEDELLRFVLNLCKKRQHFVQLTQKKTSKWKTVIWQSEVCYKIDLWGRQASTDG